MTVSRGDGVCTRAAVSLPVAASCHGGFLVHGCDVGHGGHDCVCVPVRAPVLEFDEVEDLEDEDMEEGEDTDLSVEDDEEEGEELEDDFADDDDDLEEEEQEEVDFFVETEDNNNKNQKKAEAKVSPAVAAVQKNVEEVGKKKDTAVKRVAAEVEAKVSSINKKANAVLLDITKQGQNKNLSGEWLARTCTPVCYLSAVCGWRVVWQTCGVFPLPSDDVQWRTRRSWQNRPTVSRVPRTVPSSGFRQRARRSLKRSPRAPPLRSAVLCDHGPCSCLSIFFVVLSCRASGHCSCEGKSKR